MQGLRAWFGGLPKLIMLDLDGTLVDSAVDIHGSLNRALRERALPEVDHAFVRRAVGRGASRLIEYTLQHVMPATSAHARVAEQEQLLAVFMRHYQSAVCVASTVYPGVLPFLDAAREQGVALACITNKPLLPAQGLLDALALTPYFSLILGGDSLANKKPHPQPLLHALQHFSVNAEQAVMVGDSRNDVEAARAAHVRVLALPYGYNHGEDIASCQPDLIVSSLAEML